jgi:hypothetical protein
MEIRRYVLEDELALMQMIRNEGEEWRSYWADENQTKYRIMPFAIRSLTLR